MAGLIALAAGSLLFAAAGGAPGVLDGTGRLLINGGHMVALAGVLTGVALEAPASSRGAAMGIVGAVASLAWLVEPFIAQRFGLIALVSLNVVVCVLAVVVVGVFYGPSSSPSSATSHPASAAEAGHPAAVPSKPIDSMIVGLTAAIAACAAFSALTIRGVPGAIMGDAYPIAVFLPGCLLGIVVSLVAGKFADRRPIPVLASLFGATLVLGIVFRLIFLPGAAALMAFAIAPIYQVYALAAGSVPREQVPRVVGLLTAAVGLLGVSLVGTGLLRSMYKTFSLPLGLPAVVASVAALALLRVLHRALRARPTARPSEEE
jgi:hypothetical protein